MRSRSLSAGPAIVMILLVSVLAAAGAAEPLPSYDGTHTGPRNTAAGPIYFRYDPTLAFSLTDLQATGTTATFTTTIDANQYAANWSTGANLYAVGFLRVIPGELVGGGTPLASPEHDGDPIAFFQDNQAGGPGGTAACANNQFFLNDVFVFGDGQLCAFPWDNLGQTAIDLTSAYEVTVAMSATGTYTATVTPLDVDGEVVTEFDTPAEAPFEFSGTVPGDALTQFVPFVRVRPGSDTGNGLEAPDTPWEFTISETDLDAPRAEPAATVSAIECAEDESGTVVLTTSNPGTAGALLTVAVGGTARPPVLLAGGGETTETFTVPAGGSVALAVTWVGGSVLATEVTSESCVAQTTTTTTTTTTTPTSTTSTTTTTTTRRAPRPRQRRRRPRRPTRAARWRRRERRRARRWRPSA